MSSCFGNMECGGKPMLPFEQPKEDDAVQAPQLASADVEVAGGVARISATGEFDLFTAEILASSLDEACSHGLSVELDMSAVSFIAASALGIIVHAHRSLTANGCNIEIVRPAAAVKRLLRLTDMVWLEKAEPTRN
jgi:anti-anti-sigma factor